MKIISFIHSALRGSNIHDQLKTVGDCFLLSNTDSNNCEEDILKISGSPFSSNTIKLILKKSENYDLTLFLTQNTDASISAELFSTVENSNSMCLYSDYFINGTDRKINIDFQKGSLRDGFSFGPLLCFKYPQLLFSFIKDSNYIYGGLYDLILKINRTERPFHIKKELYSIFPKKIDNRKSGEKQFDYLDSKNRSLQIEFEKVATEHLKEINAYISEDSLKKINFNKETSKITASVVIPVYNRERTIADAVNSALSQKFDAQFNVIVVDNHSTDKTTDILNEIAKKDTRLIHIIPEENDLKIGGCWNKALNSEHCGLFAVQLDSDDIYSDENTLQKIIDKFYEDQCAMVIGSYKITNFKLEALPPGIIDHKEWTNSNGMNNALRINGLGAPRAFYTPLARQILFPNCSYGEDYAMGLAISRQFKIGRIYDVLYLCRRWEGNSDADLSMEKQNLNDSAKDAMRTLEIEKRILLNTL
ncbi:MAG: glycosyltransferase family 2 protein [Paludibacteraceae bacterium]|nr:glycosyltransferase family 2 protein [Paludibacteraceae bacterium]